jgi:hypothetical protein
MHFRKNTIEDTYDVQGERLYHSDLMQSMVNNGEIYTIKPFYWSNFDNWFMGIKTFMLYEAWFKNLFVILKLFFFMPFFIITIIPHLFYPLLLLEVPEGHFRKKKLRSDYNPNENPSLVRFYSIKRVLKINLVHEPFEKEVLQRPDMMALGKLEHLDPIYAYANWEYEDVPGWESYQKQKRERISLELFMQLTTPHIVNMLDDEASVRFRLNASAKNYHGVNISKFNVLFKEDVVNNTLDAVFHYYKHRKWRHMAAHSDELFRLTQRP